MLFDIRLYIGVVVFIGSIKGMGIIIIFKTVDKNITKTEEDINTTQTKEEIIEPSHLNEEEYLDIFKSDFIWQEPFKFDKKK